MALALGTAIGFFGARGQLAAQWSRGRRTIDKSQHERSAAGDANPTPAVGEKVYVAMPLGRIRQDLATLTSHDPLVVTVAAVGAGEEGYELHLVVENRGTCDAVAYSGVAYGFDPHGSAAPMNRGGEHYVAFKKEKGKGKPLAPKAKETFAEPLHHCDLATLAVAHIDEVTCSDGSTWRR
jgi:hypothetical protein